VHSSKNRAADAALALKNTGTGLGQGYRGAVDRTYRPPGRRATGHAVDRPVDRIYSELRFT